MNNTNSSKKGKVIASIIGIVIIVACVIYLKTNKTPTSTTKAEQAVATTTSDVNVKGFDDSVTYTNARYGYKFTYVPSGPGFKLLSDMNQEQKNEFASYMGACTSGSGWYRDQSATVLCYIGNDLSPKDAFDAASFVVTATSTTAQQCETPDAWTRKSEKVVINSIPYVQEWGGEAGLSHHLAITSYKTYHNGICYSIDLNIESHATENNAEAGQVFKNLTGITMAQMQDILKSFTFTN